MDERTRDELLQAIDQLREINRRLRAENVRLAARAVEDRQHGERRLEIDVARAKGTDVLALEAEIAELRRAVAEDGGIIDRIVVYITRDLRT